MKFEWIKCKDRLPEMPTSPINEKEYIVVHINEPTGHKLYSVVGYAGGWNCCLHFDGTIDRTREFTDIIAWAEIPEFEG